MKKTYILIALQRICIKDNQGKNSQITRVENIHASFYSRYTEKTSII
jgi:hypothetical protein